jgi:uncharacterized protein (TIGR03083 family)
MRELVRHLGLIHLWAAGNVAFQPSGILEVDDLPDLAEYWPDLAAWPDDADLVNWYRDTHANLVRVLESAPTDLDCVTFLPAPSPLAMWARRQASEIAIHRFDAEMSRGFTSQFDADFATDMLDELLCGFGPRPRPLDIESAKTIHVHAEDTDEHWFLTIGPERTETARERGDVDLTLTGKAADLYLLLWNRTPDSSVTMSGDTEIMDLWHGNFRVRWS